MVVRQVELARKRAERSRGRRSEAGSPRSAPRASAAPSCRALLRRQARASLYLDRMVAPMLRPSDAELEAIQRSAPAALQNESVRARARLLLAALVRQPAIGRRPWRRFFKRPARASPSHYFEIRPWDTVRAILRRWSSRRCSATPASRSAKFVAAFLVGQRDHAGGGGALRRRHGQPGLLARRHEAVVGAGRARPLPAGAQQGELLLGFHRVAVPVLPGRSVRRLRGRAQADRARARGARLAGGADRRARHFAVDGGLELQRRVHASSTRLAASKSFRKALFDSRDPTIPVVLLRGHGRRASALLFALVAVAVTTVTGDPRFDGIGSIAIGIAAVRDRRGAGS